MIHGAGLGNHDLIEIQHYDYHPHVIADKLKIHCMTFMLHSPVRAYPFSLTRSLIPEFTP